MANCIRCILGGEREDTDFRLNFERLYIPYFPPQETGTGGSLPNLLSFETFLQGNSVPLNLVVEKAFWN